MFPEVENFSGLKKSLKIEFGLIFSVLFFCVVMCDYLLYAINMFYCHWLIKKLF